MPRAAADTYVLDADTRAFQAAMDAATQSTRNFGSAFTATIRQAITSGKGLEDTLRSLAMRLSTLALNSALAPIEKGISQTINGFISSILTPKPFARGGVVGAPALFAHSGGLGVMGEAGPEAILPLSRGADGRLGVAAAGASQPVQIVFNVQARDAESFRRTEGQLTAMLARTVQRGRNKL
ncbi:MAG: phage tail tape measure protein [Nitratireductor sp.]|nr:phage tail tape measure protein [Nitratireductor sp.]